MDGLVGNDLRHMTLDVVQYSLYGFCNSMFPIVDRYILLEWLKIFGLVLGAMFGLQLIVEVQDFSDLLFYAADFGQIIFYYMVLAPSFLTISLPAAILVSILYVAGLLHRNNEFIAFRTAGMAYRE